MTIKRLKATLVALYFIATAIAQPNNHVTRYDEQWGMEQWHITKMLQDKRGFMWFSTWNGLTRFDGYEFVSFKTHAGDGCPATSDRVRDIMPAPNDNFYCMIDERWYLFNRRTGRFSPVNNRQSRVLEHQHNIQFVPKKRVTPDGEIIKSQKHDRQGNLWTLTEQAIIKQAHYETPCQNFFMQHPAQVRCFFLDRNKNYWVTTKDDKTVRVFDAENRLKGYLTPFGTLSPTYTSFGSAVYSISQLSDGTILLGTKPDGIYCLTPQNSGKSYNVSHQSLGSVTANSVYDIRQDAYGRVWLGTFDGIYCMPHGYDFPLAVPHTEGWRVRHIHLSRDGKALMAATTFGLAIAPLPAKGKELTAHFIMHQREPDRAESLSNSATMDICETTDGRVFVSTESGGVNEFDIKNCFDPYITFKHYDKTTGLDTDVILSLTLAGHDLLIVGGNVISTFDLRSGEVRNYGKAFFHEAHQYSDAHPLQLPDSRWIFGMQEGAFTLRVKDLLTGGYVPTLVLTGYQIERQPRVLCADHLKEISLNSHQRTITLSFAALDLRAPEDIKYAFRLHQDDDWTYINNNHTLTLPDLKPGDYTLQLRSTNADGTWTDNTRTIRLHVEPLFVETVWAQILGFLLLLAIVLGAIYAWITIRRTRRKQRETLAAYLALLDKHTSATESSTASPSAPTNETSDKPDSDEESERIKQQLMQFVETYMGDSEVSMDEMASAVAMSRSVLNRKIKKLTGLSPAEFMREARIKHACQLLRDTSISVTEIAFACGFTDPKYFSKTFRQMVGTSPSNYRTNGR